MISLGMLRLIRMEHREAAPGDTRISREVMVDTGSIIMKVIWMICLEICSRMLFMAEDPDRDGLQGAAVCISEDLTGVTI